MTTKSPLHQDVGAALRVVLRHGLPLTVDLSPPALLELRGVVGRAADPIDPASRTEAADGLLRSLFARYPDPRLASGIRVLFGLDTGAGLNLMKRRALAATAVAYEADHFRKRIEPEMVDHLAAELLADADRFRNTRLIAPRLTASTARQSIPADPFAWEVTAQEESTALVWADLYSLRAALLHVERLLSLDANPEEIVDALRSAAWKWGRARSVALAHADTFPGDVSADALMSLAGWCPPISQEAAATIQTAAQSADGLDTFNAALAADFDLDQVWVRPYLESPVTRPIRERITP
ncbi:hypothetical protein [Glycomyces paridis]|uniref:hypothetical protein n=1 Tax=Glycomyces paridis TaxID=2126555 RepID=UPI0013053376|nr:hypothetical protein [Glycomyces paridis]